MKTYTVEVRRNKRQYEITGTLEELIRAFSYTLEKGKSWERERGNKKINTNPKSIASLITNLNNAEDNATVNGYSGVDYRLKATV